MLRKISSTKPRTLSWMCLQVYKRNNKASWVKSRQDLPLNPKTAGNWHQLTRRAPAQESKWASPKKQKCSQATSHSRTKRRIPSLTRLRKETKMRMRTPCPRQLPSGHSDSLPTTSPRQVLLMPARESKPNLARRSPFWSVRARAPSRTKARRPCEPNREKTLKLTTQTPKAKTKRPLPKRLWTEKPRSLTISSKREASKNFWGKFLTPATKHQFNWTLSSSSRAFAETSTRGNSSFHQI